MAVITWRNVEAGNQAGILGALNNAAQNIGNSFTGLQQTVRNMEIADKQAQDRQRETNTNAYLDALQRYGTPEALQAAQASGELNRLRASYGNAINSAAVRGAEDQLLATRRSQALAGRQFANQVAADDAAPILSRAQALALNGDIAGARELTATLPERYQGEAAKNTFGAERDLFGFKVAQNTEGRAQAKHALDLRNGEAQIVASNASANASNASAAASRANTALTNLKVDEFKSDKQAENAANELANRYQVETQRQKDKMAEIAKNNPSLFGDAYKNGKIDITKMDSSQIAAADALGKQMGLRGMEVYTAGDTEAMNQTVQALRTAGASQQVIDKVLANPNRFDTTGAPRTGNDAATRAKALEDRAILEQKIVREEGGLPTTKSDLNSTIKNALANIPDKTQAAEASKAISRYYASKGATDSNGQRVYLPAEEIARIVGGMQKTFSNGAYVPFTNNWNESMEAALKDAEKNRSASLVKAAELVERQKLRSSKDNK